MSIYQIVLTVASAIFGGGVTGVSAVIFMWRRQGPKVKAQTAKIAAETTETGIRTQGDLIEQLERLADQVNEQGKQLLEQSNTIRGLRTTVEEQGAQIVALQQRNRDLGAAMRAAVVELLAWIRRALSVMTPDQQTTVGQPPDYQHLVTPPERS